MAERKKRSYRKKKTESDDESESAVDQSLKSESETSTPRAEEDVSSTIEELEEIRKLRRKHAGIDSAKLSKGEEKKKKKAPPANSDPWKLKTGGLVDKNELHASEDSEKPEQKLKLDSFTTQTNTLDVDKHMMAYIEDEMKKRRGDNAAGGQVPAEGIESKGYQDIYDELYKIPEHLRVDKKPVIEGNVQLSTQMLTAIPEVDLGMDVRLQNIEATERAKRTLSENQHAGNKQRSQPEYNAPSRFSLPKATQDNSRSRSDKRHTASDDVVMERFKKRMRN